MPALLFQPPRAITSAFPSLKFPALKFSTLKCPNLVQLGQLCLGSAVLGIGSGILQPVQGQIVPDRTLPTPSVVQSQGDSLTIPGGIENGGNLFHSFEQFSVQTGQTAVFQHGGIERIFSRVTGNLPSDIDGTIRAGESADLFLLNPNGVLFGPNARLEIGGSFFATTAEQVTFADGTVWGMGGEASAPLLTATVPLGLQWGGRSGEIRAIGGEAVPEMEAGAEVTRNTVPTPDGGLSVTPGNTLALLGRSLKLDGAYLTAPGGQSILAAVGANGDVPLVPTDLGWRLGNVTGAASHGAIRLERGAVIDVSGPSGGAVQIFGDSYFMGDRSIILADTLGDRNGRGVDVNVGNINLVDGSFVSSVSFGSGNAGSINITGDEIVIVGARPLQDALTELFAMSVQNPSLLGSGFFAMGFNTGDSGNISVTANNLTMSTSAFLSVAPSGGGNGGLIDLNIADTLLLDGAEIFADTFGSGRAGDITARARRIVGINGGGLFASTFAGRDGGALRIFATESIDSIGATSDGSFASGLSSNSYPDSTGTGGLVLLRAPVVRLLDGGLAVAVVFGEGAGVT
ncbi:MAG: filamentous hemagglutinin N-terminal domain-containing protein, partial [Cyanophyceae cyanobacterium]